MLFFFPCLLWPSFFSLLLFLFSVFSLSRSGAPDVKRPRYGFIPFYLGSELFFFSFFRGIDSASCPETFSKVSLFLLTYSSALYLFYFFTFSLFTSLHFFPNLSQSPRPFTTFFSLAGTLSPPSFPHSFISLGFDSSSFPCFYLLPSLCAVSFTNLWPTLPPLVLSNGSRPGPSSLTTFDPATWSRGWR